MVAIVAIALGVALATHAAGLSLGLGAFLAGIVVCDTGLEAQVRADYASYIQHFDVAVEDRT